MPPVRVHGAWVARAPPVPDIPEAVIRRRFGKGAEYLQKVYKSLVDEWYVWDSLEGAFALAEAWDQK
jgi:predicted ABC-type ATPase